MDSVILQNISKALVECYIKQNNHEELSKLNTPNVRIIFKHCKIFNVMSSMISMLGTNMPDFKLFQFGTA